MKNLIYITLSILIGCGISTNKTGCIENKEFKEAFFKNISFVENYMHGKGHRPEYKSGLDFISRYVEVSYEEMLNYSGSYTNIEAFEKDKKRWLEWYEDNKCNNIQFVKD